MWIEKSNLAPCKVRAKSLDLASCEANLSHCRAQRLLSREAKAKASLCADSEVKVASLLLPARGTKTVLICNARTKTLCANVLSHDANNEAPLGACSETTPTLLKARALLCSPPIAELKRQLHLMKLILQTKLF